MGILVCAFNSIRNLTALHVLQNDNVRIRVSEGEA